jgi:hypothetical protein
LFREGNFVWHVVCLTPGQSVFNGLGFRSRSNTVCGFNTSLSLKLKSSRMSLIVMCSVSESKTHEDKQIRSASQNIVHNV